MRASPNPQRQHPDGRISNDYVGLAISGGGIRSATFHLGILQTLARARLISQIDFMSTVSGGGYIGAFLGRLFTRAAPKAQKIVEGVCQRFEDSQSAEVEWLRRSANYIAPNRSADVATGVGFYLRSFLTVHFILLLTLFTVLGVLNFLTESVRPATAMIIAELRSARATGISKYLQHLPGRAKPNLLDHRICLLDARHWRDDRLLAGFANEA